MQDVKIKLQAKLDEALTSDLEQHDKPTNSNNDW